MADLEKETREALLNAIKDALPAPNITSLERLANAFALTVGANRGKLPGLQPASSS